jgi:hypothetical protein
VDPHRAVGVRGRVKWQHGESQRQPPQVVLTLVAWRAGQNLHHYRLGGRHRAVSRDHLGQPLIRRAAGGPVVLHPRRRVGQDDDGSIGPVPAGSSEMACAPRMDRASSQVMG